MQSYYPARHEVVPSRLLSPAGWANDDETFRGPQTLWQSTPSCNSVPAAWHVMHNESKVKGVVCRCKTPFAALRDVPLSS